jgi:hypothetical protein
VGGFFGVDEPTLVTHNDLAPYNVCFEGDRLAGVFDWDLAGPSTPLLELAPPRLDGVPLFRPVPAARRRPPAARRWPRVRRHTGATSSTPCRARAGSPSTGSGRRRAGDEQMRNLVLIGEPERTERALADC